MVINPETLTIQKLRNLATALERQEAFDTWVGALYKGDPKTSMEEFYKQVHVTWHWAASCTGYKEVTTEVTKVVQEMMPKVLNKAKARLSLAVEQAFKELEQ